MFKFEVYFKNDENEILVAGFCNENDARDFVEYKETIEETEYIIKTKE